MKSPLRSISLVALVSAMAPATCSSSGDDSDTADAADNGGIAGRMVEIVAVDDGADHTTGVAAAGAAIEAGLDGIVGPCNSGVGADTLLLYIEAGLVPIRLTSDDSTAGFGSRLQPMTSQIAPMATRPGEGHGY